ncbi:MAG: hypothetical protein AAF364_03045 [Pseudomonadota bacterium]
MSIYGISINNAIAKSRRQRGMVILGIVIILLTITAFLTGATSRAVQHFLDVDRSITSSNDIEFSLTQSLRDIAAQLRTTSPQNIPKISADVTHSINALSLLAKNQQHLEQYHITVSSVSHNITLGEQYLRYPALLNIPTIVQATTFSPAITESLFNRNIQKLTGLYFPTPDLRNACDDLAEASVHWVVGDCVIDNNDVDHANSASPMLIIVKNGNITLAKNTTFEGLLVHLSTTPTKYTLSLKSGASINGAFLSNTQLIEHIAGSMHYSSKILTTLQRKPSLQKIIPITGSWYVQ